MEQHLLALDLDGTACNDAGHLGQRTKQALAAARKAGHIVCFATGRRDTDMAAFWEEALCADYLLLNNGGKLVRTADGAVLFNRCAQPDAVRRLVQHCLQQNYVLHVQRAGQWQVNRWMSGLQSYVDWLGTAPTLYSTLAEVCCEGVEGMMATEEMDAVCRFIDEEGLPLTYVRSEETCTDIMCPGISKWSGLQRLLKLLGIPPQRTVAAGDYDNDLEMVTHAGVGVAVRNAQPCVRAAARYVTARTNNEDAVEEIVQQFLL